VNDFPIGRTVLAVLLLGGSWLWWSQRPLRHAPGVLVAGEPAQVNIPEEILSPAGDFQLTKVAEYRVRGRVLRTKVYHSGVQARIVPVDVALGWGRMSDQAVLDQFRLSMGNRFFFFEWEGAPAVPREEITRSVANHHVISASKDVARKIKRLRIGQIAEMRGWLVDVKGPDGFQWKTSRTRGDSGNGACEVLYATGVEAWDAPPTDAIVLGGGQME
jgi:hypothetical protein